jgi:hypothetical protein
LSGSKVDVFCVEWSNVDGGTWRWRTWTPHFDNFGLAYLFMQFSLKTYGCYYIFWGYISQKLGWQPLEMQCYLPEILLLMCNM